MCDARWGTRLRAARPARRSLNDVSTATVSDSKIAELSDVPDVLGVLNAAATRLRTLGIAQWPAEFKDEWVVPAIQKGETWLFNRSSATVTIDCSDPLWANRPGEAMYVHRLATRDGHPGLGGAVLRWVEMTAVRGGCSYLRLDCVAQNDRLREYYQDLDYSFVGTAVVGARPARALPKVDELKSPCTRKHLPSVSAT